MNGWGLVVRLRCGWFLDLRLRFASVAAVVAIYGALGFRRAIRVR
ncbi:hypothetical protein RSSM_02883 [Rhodopirellula sallentina SM41]|uniref:Uncharacterized protein n=1 Tax=Rhodopirellula sallentina SM41 TaxID=1263870 RepID=M5U2I6_9BACT|nr:hypothetical protein RSSM_02883 [Rhodopirellula sallentina SM41]